MVLAAKPALEIPTNFKASTDGAVTTFAWDGVPGAAGYLLRVHKIGEPYDPCSAMAFCNAVLLTASTKDLTLPAGDYDAWVHAAKSATDFGESQGLQYVVPIDETPAIPTGLILSKLTPDELVVTCSLVDCPKGLGTVSTGSVKKGYFTRTVKRIK